MASSSKLDEEKPAGDPDAAVHSRGKDSVSENQARTEETFGKEDNDVIEVGNFSPRTPRGGADRSPPLDALPVERSGCESPIRGGGMDSDTKGESLDQRSDLRKTAGQAMHTISDAINENIVIARYGTMATITLLVGYGVYKTPLFFRYRTVFEIPPDHFARRKTIHGRIVGIMEGDSSLGQASATKKEVERPVMCLVRHLSPMGRLQSRAAFDFSAENSPSARLAGQLEKSKDLLKIEIAGVKLGPHYHNPLEREGQWLRRLAAERTPVICQLLSRRVIQNPVESKKEAADSPAAGISDAFNDPFDPDSQQSAVCRLKYRPPRSLFRQDIALSLVKCGRANVASGIHTEDSFRPTVDGSTNIEDLRKDAAYLEMLEKAEFEAVKNKLGMWNDHLVRKARPDLVDEADFDVNAGVRKKLWRWVRGKIGL